VKRVGELLLTFNCDRGLDKGWEGKGVGNCVLTSDCVRGIGKRIGRERRGGIVC